jgi:damage-control phosphatase, subfamily I
MKTVMDCIPCLVRQAEEAIALVAGNTHRREQLMRTLLHDIAGADWGGSPPEMAQRIHRIIRQELGCDPYASIKTRMNRMAAQILPELRATMERQPDSREAAVRLAIGGNLLDVGAKTRIAAEELPDHLASLWTHPLRGDGAALFRAADEAHCILYLTDNAGEIFFDRMLIEALPAEKITVVVRGHPVLNDATMEDAEAAGLPDIAPVFDNGSDVPGTVVSDCSAEFQAWYDRADLVIAKGQGNFETLSDTTKHTFFLFTVKCPVVARHIGEPIGSLVIREHGAVVQSQDHPG